MKNPRYRIDGLHAGRLENNPAGSPVERYVHVYLPPGYEEDSKRRYPVVYFLHGYDGNYRKVAVYSGPVTGESIARVLPPDLADRVNASRMASYDRFDELISGGDLSPFIFVQPDASLHLPHYKGIIDPATNMHSTKGSFYLNSPHMGRYEDYIISDVVRYIDSNYRTVPEKWGRSLAGASMGGYGTLSIGLHHPDLFVSLAALSPANITIDRLSWKLIIPAMELSLGREFAEKSGHVTWKDILDTLDMVFSANRPLLPGIIRNAKGEPVDCDALAAAEWKRRDLAGLIAGAGRPYADTALSINCDIDDEFGFGAATGEIHRVLLEKGKEHEFDLYSDPEASLSPHILGIAYRILPAIRFCLGHCEAAVEHDRTKQTSSVRELDI